MPPLMDIELSLLEVILRDEELKCQSAHVMHEGGKIECSVEVVARKTTQCKSLDFFICKNSYVINVEHLERNGLCGTCGRVAKDCWEVYPI